MIRKAIGSVFAGLIVAHFAGCTVDEARDEDDDDATTTTAPDDGTCTKADFDNDVHACDGDNVMECKQSGSGYVWIVDEDCAEDGEQCQQGECVSDAPSCGSECTDMRYTKCTCSAADPCGWANDGACDDKCFDYTDNPFDDSIDCASSLPASVGDPCTADTDCASNFCTSSDGWCSLQCTYSSDCGSPSDGGYNFCVPTNSGYDYCFTSCSTSADCAAFPGTYCKTANTTVGVEVKVCSL